MNETPEGSDGLLANDPSDKINLRSLEPIRRTPTSEQIKHACDYPSPFGLVTGSQSWAVYRRGNAVEQNVIFEWGLPETSWLFRDWTIHTGIAQKYT